MKTMITIASVVVVTFVIAVAVMGRIISTIEKREENSWRGMN